jgi:hypothetical protein
VISCLLRYGKPDRVGHGCRHASGPRGFFPAGAAGASGSYWPAPGSGQQFLQEHSPADQGVAALADAGLHRQVEIAGLVDQAADLAGRLGDVDQQHVPATGNVILGHEAVPLVSHGAGPRRSGAAPLNTAV